MQLKKNASTNDHVQEIVDHVLVINKTKVNVFVCFKLASQRPLTLPAKLRVFRIRRIKRIHLNGVFLLSCNSSAVVPFAS